MIRKRIRKKIKNIVLTHIGKTLEQTTTLKGFIEDLTDLFISRNKKEINIALRKQRHKLQKESSGDN